MGSLHLRYPNYNALSVSDLLTAINPAALVITSLSESELATPSWQDCEEIVLPMSVIPWARQNNKKVFYYKEESPDKNAYYDFRRYARAHPPLQDKISRCDLVLRPLNSLLLEPLNLERILSEVVPIIHEHKKLEEELLEEGPATNWQRSRSKAMAKRILATQVDNIAVLVAIDDYPFLREELEKEADLAELGRIEVNEKSQQRALMDYAFRSDVANPEQLVEQLQKIGSAEASYHMANIMLANGELEQAFETMLEASKGNFAEPYYLPGYLLARLGQIYDLKDNRKMALKSYRGVLAIDYAPKEAIAAAKQGLEAAFQWPVAVTAEVDSGQND